MSIVKDLLWIIVLVYFIFKTFLLYKNLVKQREYFIDILSHDLRIATIAQIRGLDLLRKNKNVIASQCELIDEINNSCKFSLEMITMLLNKYRFENGEVVLNNEELSVTEMFLVVSKTLAKYLDEKDINIILNADKKMTIYADKEIFCKAMTMLIFTAICNAFKNTKIYINIKRDFKKYEFSIVYNGKNLTEEECRRMFYDNPKFSTVGQGIKLHLCKEIIKLHKGNIIVKNCGKGMNSFTFTMPVKKNDIVIKPTLLSSLEFNS